MKECGGAVEGEIEEIATTKEFVVLSTRKKGILSAENNGMLVRKWMDLPGPVHKQSETTRRGSSPWRSAKVAINCHKPSHCIRLGQNDAGFFLLKPTRYLGKCWKQKFPKVGNQTTSSFCLNTCTHIYTPNDCLFGPRLVHC